LAEEAVAKGAEGNDVFVRELDLEHGYVVHHRSGDASNEEEHSGGEEEESADMGEETEGHFEYDLLLSLLSVKPLRTKMQNSSRLYSTIQYNTIRRPDGCREREKRK
jgi:hypothetical protein